MKMHSKLADLYVCNAPMGVNLGLVGSRFRLPITRV